MAYPNAERFSAEDEAKEVKVIKSSNQDVLSDSEKLEDLKELEALEKLEKEERKHVSNSEEE